MLSAMSHDIIVEGFFFEFLETTQLVAHVV